MRLDKKLTQKPHEVGKFEKAWKTFNKIYYASSAMNTRGYKLKMGVYKTKKVLRTMFYIIHGRNENKKYANTANYGIMTTLDDNEDGRNKCVKYIDYKVRAKNLYPNTVVDILSEEILIFYNYLP